jgi:hypothetical protein
METQELQAFIVSAIKAEIVKWLEMSPESARGRRELADARECIAAYDPAGWLNTGGLSAAERKAFSRAAERLEAAGKIERLADGVRTVALRLIDPAWLAKVKATAAARDAKHAEDARRASWGSWWAVMPGWQREEWRKACGLPAGSRARPSYEAYRRAQAGRFSTRTTTSSPSPTPSS